MYPWGDFHSLNLGWFLVQFKAWTEKIQEYLDNGGGTSENLANVIAPVFNAENSYLTGDYVLYNNELYKALEPVPAGTWNPDAWERCLVTEEMGSAASGVDNVARLMIAGQYSNTYNYQKYAICRYNDKLWMCNTNLPAGGEEWVPSHWDEITVGAGLTGLRRSADTLSQAITAVNEAISQETEARQEADSELQSSIDSLTSDNISNESTDVSGTTVTDALNNLKGSLNTITPVVVDASPTQQIACTAGTFNTIANVAITKGTWLIYGFHEWANSVNSNYTVSLRDVTNSIDLLALTNLSMLNGGGTVAVTIVTVNNATIRYGSYLYGSTNNTTKNTRLIAVKIIE